MKNFYRSVLWMLLVSASLQVKAQVPALSSYPSASGVIFLDFDGQTVSGTAWNSSGPIYCGAAGVTNAQITEIFNRVSEDYRPFNINITTDSTVYFAAPITKRIRVIVTVTSAWYGSAGGTAMIGSFTWGDDTPCFVFSQLLGTGNTKWIAEACSHEAGHTLGLYHQSNYDVNCNKVSDYHSGIGTGEISWAPIMGTGYYKNLTLWNNGPTPYGCTSYQNDLDVITTGNGFTYRNDDYAGTFAGASTETFVGNQFTTSGVIERNTDQDMVKFTTTAYGRFQLSAVPYNVGTGNNGSDLDMQVTLYNNSQTQLNIYNPSTLLNSVIDTMLNPGTYFLKIEGKGNIYAPNYASLGSYSVQGTFSLNTLPLHRLELHGQIVHDQHLLNWIIDADEQVETQVLEYSTDGREFRPLIQPATAARNYSYPPTISGTIQYRLSVLFDNGHHYYSNVVTLRKTNNDIRPKIVSNVISGSTVEVSSPGVFNYYVYDLSGKTFAQGKLANGSNIINTASLSSGMYFIRYSDADEQWTDKFVKQQ